MRRGAAHSGSSTAAHHCHTPASGVENRRVDTHTVARRRDPGGTHDPAHKNVLDMGLMEKKKKKKKK